MGTKLKSQERIVTVFSDWILTAHHQGGAKEGEDPASWANPQVAEAKPRDVQARLREVPPDTRSITGFLFGDPIPNDPRRQSV